MKKQATVLKDTRIYEAPDPISEALQSVKANSFIKVGKEKRRGHLNWFQAQLEDGTVGYIFSKHIFIWELHKIDEDTASFRSESFTETNEKIRLVKKDRFHIIMPVSKVKTDPIKIKDALDRIGFLPQTVKKDAVSDTWVNVLVYVLLGVAIIGALVAMIGAGFIVVGPLVIVVLIIPVIIVAVAVNLFVELLKGIVREFSIRL